MKFFFLFFLTLGFSLNSFGQNYLSTEEAKVVLKTELQNLREQQTSNVKLTAIQYNILDAKIQYYEQIGLLLATDTPTERSILRAYPALLKPHVEVGGFTPLTPQESATALHETKDLLSN
jgi:hypothetical protein